MHLLIQKSSISKKSENVTLFYILLTVQIFHSLTQILLSSLNGLYSWFLTSGLIQEISLSLLFSLQACLTPIPLPSCISTSQWPGRTKNQLDLSSYGHEGLEPCIHTSAMPAPSSWSLQQSWSTMSLLCGQPTCSPFAWPGTQAFHDPGPCLPIISSISIAFPPSEYCPCPSPHALSNTVLGGLPLPLSPPPKFPQESGFQRKLQPYFALHSPCLLQVLQWKNGKEQPGQLMHSSLGCLGSFPLPLHMLSLPRAGFCFEKTSCPDLPGLGAFKLFYLVPGLVSPTAITI